MDIDRMAARYAHELAKHYERGFGISPAADPSENFYRQLWTRDFAHAAAHYFATALPEAVEDSFATILRHQRADGSLPIRVEKEYLLLKLIPGLRFLSRPAFTVIERGVRRRTERPVYAGQDFLYSEDTVPAALIAAGIFFNASPRGRSFIETRADALRRACEYFTAKADPNDGLASVRRGTVDWADSILRGGKLGVINVLWVQALENMRVILSSAGDEQRAQRYRTLHTKAKAALMQKLYCEKGAYFRTCEHEDRIDTVATILGSLFFLPADECVRVQETLEKRVRVASGFSNFDPPYPPQDILWPHKLIGHGGYHNVYAWPWVTCQNIFVKIKIAKEHPSAESRERYKAEAIQDLLDTARLFEEAGGAWEVFFPASRKPAITRWFRPARNLLANIAAFEDAYMRLRSLGWLT